MNQGAGGGRRVADRLRWLAYGPRLAQLVVTRRCNLDCGYCNEFDKTSPPVPARTVMRWIDRLAALRCRCLELTGGETLLHPEIVRLVRYGSSLGFAERWIITNGFLLSSRLIAGLNDAGLTHLQISVDGVAANATTVKTLLPLRRKMEMLAAQARFTVQVNAVLGAGDPAEAVEVARCARRLGFVPRVSILHDGLGAMIADERGRQALGQLQRAVGARWEESCDYRARLLREGRAEFKCRAGARYLYVDEFGLVNWCSQQRGVFTRPLLAYGWDDLREQFYTRKPCAPTCTVGCVRTAGRFDEWRRQSIERAAPPRAAAVNEGTLIPAESLRPRTPAPARRSQAAWRLERSRQSKTSQRTAVKVPVKSSPR